MIINANTRIGAIIKNKPEALELIIGIRPAFEKLRNPLLRKLIAGRTSIAMASKLGGCSVTDFFDTLRPLGFEIDSATLPEEEKKLPVPEFILTLKKEQVVELDVRPAIQSGQDPLKQILDKVNGLAPAQVLKIINSFEPTPLIAMLEKKGYVSHVDTVSEEEINTYFYKAPGVQQGPQQEEVRRITEQDVRKGPEQTGPEQTGPKGTEEDIFKKAEQDVQERTGPADWDRVAERFKDKLDTVDVRELAMPLPMHTILQALDELDPGKALFVYHKRIPVFLLSELAERGFDYRIREIKEGDVNMLIYKK